MKVIIFGALGMLGSELERQLKIAGHEVFSFDSDLDITDREKIAEKIAELKPDAIFNCAAYNAVDKAEDDAAIATSLNADAPGFIAEAAKNNNAILVHYGTGYIFDGSSEKGYNEDDQPNPQSIYAKSKYQGEKNIQEKCEKYYIIRLNLLFGKPGLSAGAKKSFPELIQELAKTKDSFDFISDEISGPTYAPDLARASIALVKGKYPFGIYHLANAGIASWEDWAKEIFRIKDIKAKINSVPAAQMKRKALRPKNSVLINNKFPKQRSWQEANEEFLKENK